MPDELLEHLAYALQLAVGCVFVLSVLPKLRRPAAFVRTVEGYELLPRLLAPAAAGAVIAVEAALAFCLITGWLLAIALPVAAVTLIGFGVAAAINLRRGRDVVCGCFGSPTERVSGRSVARVLLLLGAVAIAGIFGGVSVGELAGEDDALAYVVNMAGVAASLLLASMWLLTLPELRTVLRGAGRDRRDA